MAVDSSLRELLRLLGEKWNIDILFFCREPRHFNEILHELSPITNHVLALKLQELQAAGLLSHVDEQYSCTEKCAQLCDIISQVSTILSKD